MEEREWHNNTKYKKHKKKNKTNNKKHNNNNDMKKAWKCNQHKKNKRKKKHKKQHKKNRNTPCVFEKKCIEKKLRPWILRNPKILPTRIPTVQKPQLQILLFELKHFRPSPKVMKFLS